MKSIYCLGDTPEEILKKYEELCLKYTYITFDDEPFLNSEHILGTLSSFYIVENIFNREFNEDESTIEKELIDKMRNSFERVLIRTMLKIVKSYLEHNTCKK